MNETLYNFTKDFLDKQRQGGKIKYLARAKELYEQYGFGQVDLAKKWLTFTFENRVRLTAEIKAELSVDIMFDAYPARLDRNTNATTHFNEKTNSYPVSNGFVLVNSLSKLKINQHCYDLAPMTSLGTYLKADDILSIEHKSIVFVENLAVMASLLALNITTLADTLTVGIDLNDALWVYRGDAKKYQQTGIAYQFFRRFAASHQLVCFSDVDPKGIEIALTSHADYWLTIKNTGDFDKITTLLKGNEVEWFKQGASVQFIQKKISASENKGQALPSWQPLFSMTSSMQKTLKQEHIIAHCLPLTLCKL
ncbi:MAG: hypothetical protein JKX76_09375 [Colwellia sp.]|nr:hypothetical protein [Colwellia sp.]